MHDVLLGHGWLEIDVTEYDRDVKSAPAETTEVVVATDGSESADGAVRAGAALARELGARTVLVYVRPSLGTLGEPYYQEKLSEQMAHARAALDRARRLAGEQGVEPDEEILEGEPAEQIVGLADARDALMIVIGSRGLGAVAGALLGSVSSAVLHRAGRPVLVVPGPHATA
jgi:nucleotide-binding universal stress UspA family protein